MNPESFLSNFRGSLHLEGTLLVSLREVACSIHGSGFHMVQHDRQVQCVFVQFGCLTVLLGLEGHYIFGVYGIAANIQFIIVAGTGIVEIVVAGKGTWV